MLKRLRGFNLIEMYTYMRNFSLGQVNQLVKSDVLLISCKLFMDVVNSQNKSDFISLFLKYFKNYARVYIR